MDSRFTGAFAYADDITLLAPCKSALLILVSVSEKYVSEFDILFNGSKSKLLFFKGRFSNGIESEVMFNGEIVNISNNAVHLGHFISSSDGESILWKSFNSLISNVGHTYSLIKCSLFKQICCSFYGSPL